VAAHDFVQTPLQGIQVEPALQAKNSSQIMGCCARLEVVNPPESLLPEGEWNVPIAWVGLDGRGLML
jgi:hypothetical protein